MMSALVARWTASRFVRSLAVVAGGLTVCGGAVAADALERASSVEEAMQRLRPLAAQMQVRMQAHDMAGVLSTVDEIKAMLGPLAGTPAKPEHYALPINTVSPDRDVLIGTWDALFGEVLSRRGVRGAPAAENRSELREHAYIALACVAAIDADLPQARRQVARVREELDYLLARQDTDGLFPYPAYPALGDAPPKVLDRVARLRAEHPGAVRDRYLYLNVPDMQFDVGCCGVAMIAGYDLLGRRDYLESARRAGEWAIQSAMSANWNHNAFSVWLLSKLYQQSGEARYLEAALSKAEFGVLPGLLPSGRWIDPHNAAQNYHFIMVRALSSLAAAMPTGHPKRAMIVERVLLATDSRVEDILEDGVSNTISALWGLSDVIQNHGGTPQRLDAAHAIVNALLTRRADEAVVVLPMYLLATRTDGPRGQRTR